MRCYFATVGRCFKADADADADADEKRDDSRRYDSVGTAAVEKGNATIRRDGEGAADPTTDEEPGNFDLPRLFRLYAQCPTKEIYGNLWKFIEIY